MMVWWRFKTKGGPWSFGFMTEAPGPNLVRMGLWNGDTSRGPVVDRDEIETRPYNG